MLMCMTIIATSVAFIIAEGIAHLVGVDMTNDWEGANEEE